MKAIKWMLLAVIFFLSGCELIPVDDGDNPNLPETNHTIHFHSNGGNEITDMTTDQISSIDDIPVPLYEGYEFIGWFLEEGFVTEYDMATLYEGEIDLYAKWSPVEYIWDIWDKDLQSSEEIIITVETDFTTLLDSYESIEGYSFVEWRDVETDDVIDLENVVFVARGIYPVFSNQTFRLSFLSNQTITIDDEIIDYGNTITLPTPPTIEGYTFGGFYTSDQYDTEFTQTTMDNSDVTVYLLYDIIEYTITLEATGGSFTDQDSEFLVEYNTAVPNIEIPEKVGHRFLGWYLDDAYTTILSDDYTVTKDITLYAKWEEMEASISFVTNSDTTIDVYEYAVGELIEAPINPVKTGYTFGGWYEEDTLQTEYIFDTMPDGNITLYASWIPIKHTIYFTDFDSSIITSYLIDYETDLSLFIYPDDPSRFGYTFDGWDSTLPDTMPNSDLYLQATYLIGTYTITLNTMNGEEMDPLTGEYLSTVDTPHDPIREGYTFNGWYEDYERTTEYTFDTMPGEDITVYAKWTINYYTVNVYDVNGDIVQTKRVMYSNGFTPGLGPEIEHYTFDGWYLDPTFETSMNLIIYIKEDTNIYPKYTGDAITVRYDSNVPDTTIEYGSEIGEMPVAEREGYTFIGWYVYGSGSYDAIDETYVVTQSISLKAKFSINEYTISFVTNGGQVMDPLTVRYSDNIYIKTTPELTGMTFVGWYLDESLTTEFTHQRMPAEDLTLYAKWEEAQHTMHYQNSSINSSIFVSDYVIYQLDDGRFVAISYAEIEDNVSHTNLIDVTDQFNAIYEGDIDYISDGKIHYTDGTIYSAPHYNGDDIIEYVASYTLYEQDGYRLFETTILQEQIKQYVSSFSVHYVLTESGKLFVQSDDVELSWLQGGTTPTSYTDCTDIFGLNQDEIITGFSTDGRTHFIFTSENRVFGWGKNSRFLIENPLHSTETVLEYYDIPYDMTFKFDIDDTDAIKEIRQIYTTILVVTVQNRLFMMGQQYDGLLAFSFVAPWVDIDDYEYNPNDFYYGSYDAFEITYGFHFEQGETIEHITFNGDVFVVLTSYGRLFIGGDNYVGVSTHTQLHEITDTVPLDADEYIIHFTIDRYENTLLVVSNKGRMFMQSSYDFYTAEGTSTSWSSAFLEMMSILPQPNLTSYSDTYHYQDIVSLDIPIVDGYTFIGYYLDPELTIPLTEMTMPDEDAYIYLKWEPISYTITFHTNGGETLPTATYPTDMFLSSFPIPVKEGHTFMGWYLDEELTIPYDSLYMLPHDFDVYAKWEINTYSVSYMENWIRDINGNESEHLLVDNFGRLFYWGYNQVLSHEDYATKVPVDISPLIALQEGEQIIQAFFLFNRVIVETSNGRVLELDIYEEHVISRYTSYHILTDDVIVPNEISNINLQEGEHIKEIYPIGDTWGVVLLTTEGRVFERNLNLAYWSYSHIDEEETFYDISSLFDGLGTVQDIENNDYTHSTLFLIDGLIYYMGDHDMISSDMIVSPLNLSEQFDITDIQFLYITGFSTSTNRFEFSAVTSDYERYIFTYERIIENEETTYSTSIYTKSLHEYYDLRLEDSTFVFDGDTVLLNQEGTTYYVNKYFGSVNLTLLVGEYIIEMYQHNSSTYYITNFGRLFVEGYNYGYKITFDVSEHEYIDLMEIGAIFPSDLSVYTYVEYVYDTTLDTHTPLTSDRTFIEWYNDESFITPFIDTTMSADNRVLYGAFEPNRYSLHLVDQGEMIYHYDVEEGYPITLEQLLITGYSFDGWYLDYEYTIPFTQGMLMPGEDLILYVKRNINDYGIVAYDECIKEISVSPYRQFILYCDGAVSYHGLFSFIGYSGNQEVSVNDLMSITESIVDIQTYGDTLILLTESGKVYFAGGYYAFDILETYEQENYIDVTALLPLSEGEYVIQLPTSINSGFDLDFAVLTNFGNIVGFNREEYVSYNIPSNLGVKEFSIYNGDVILIFTNYQAQYGEIHLDLNYTSYMEWETISLSDQQRDIIDVTPLDLYYYAVFYDDGTMSIYYNSFYRTLQDNIPMPYHLTSDMEVQHMFTEDRDVYLVFNDGTIWKFVAYQHFLNEEQTSWQYWYTIEDVTDTTFLDGNLIQTTYDDYDQSYIVYNDNDLFFIGESVQLSFEDDQNEYFVFQYVDGYFANMETSLYQYHQFNYGDSLTDYTITPPTGYSITGYYINGIYSDTLDLPSTVTSGYEIIVVLEALS